MCSERNSYQNNNKDIELTHSVKIETVVWESNVDFNKTLTACYLQDKSHTLTGLFHSDILHSHKESAGGYPVDSDILRHIDVDLDWWRYRYNSSLGCKDQLVQLVLLYDNNNLANMVDNPFCS